jgi:hypothetical protein
MLSLYKHSLFPPLSAIVLKIPNILRINGYTNETVKLIKVFLIK